MALVNGHNLSVKSENLEVTPTALSSYCRLLSQESRWKYSSHTKKHTVYTIEMEKPKMIKKSTKKSSSGPSSRRTVDLRNLILCAMQ